MYLPNKERYDEIEQAVYEMLEETGINTIPIDPFEVARRLKYVLVPYSSLKKEKFIEAINRSTDGYSAVEKDSSGMYHYYIYYNDIVKTTCEMRHMYWTIMHEIGHCYLGHHDLTEEELPDDVAEAEANYYAKYTFAPTPLINAYECKDANDIVDKFNVSYESAGYLYRSYWNWLHNGPINYLPLEIKFLNWFLAA
ncbi:ImmA/IrrE family metallo-endopeptidase [Butyrivibrio sp. MB2005]|uniref:ImmA/IrrE family metallo-endopeptidase n=1 Tax=Butyrivibrio sp. MB2005 TaxID=1280678 RepID=UPI000403A52C|nr:ImmA/IrrE family metallo-endopeptidase [Butyrivibrio sp. MB2005]